MSFDPQASQFEVEIKRSRHHAQKAKDTVTDMNTTPFATARAQVHATLSVAAALRAEALRKG